MQRNFRQLLVISQVIDFHRNFKLKIPLRGSVSIYAFLFVRENILLGCSELTWFGVARRNLACKLELEVFNRELIFSVVVIEVHFNFLAWEKLILFYAHGRDRILTSNSSESARSMSLFLFTEYEMMGFLVVMVYP